MYKLYIFYYNTCISYELHIDRLVCDNYIYYILGALYGEYRHWYKPYDTKSHFHSGKTSYDVLPLRPCAHARSSSNNSAYFGGDHALTGSWSCLFPIVVLLLLLLL